MDKFIEYFFQEFFKIPDYNTIGWDTWLVNAIFATLGLFIRLVHNDEPILLPKKTEEGGLKLNIFGEWIVAVGVGSLVDHNILLVTMSGACAPLIISRILNAMNKKLSGDIK